MICDVSTPKQGPAFQPKPRLAKYILECAGKQNDVRRAKLLPQPAASVVVIVVGAVCGQSSRPIDTRPWRYSGPSETREALLPPSSQLPHTEERSLCLVCIVCCDEGSCDGN
jgi:hypothetical protein